MDTELSLWIKPVILGLFSPVTHFPLGGEGRAGETAFADIGHISLASPGGEEVHGSLLQTVGGLWVKGVRIPPG